MIDEKAQGRDVHCPRETNKRLPISLTLRKERTGLKGGDSSQGEANERGGDGQEEREMCY